MKKLILGSLIVAASGLCMTSCLDGGSNQTSGYAYGVIEMGTLGQKFINVGEGSIKFYSSAIANDASIDYGDCCLFAYSLDYDSDANIDASTKGYYTVASDYYEKINSPYVQYPLADTTTIDPKELVVTQIENLGSNYSIWPLIKSSSNIYMFLPTYHEGVLKGQKQSFDLSFNLEQEPQQVSGENVYDLYLRVVKTADGESPSSSGSIVNAFNMTTFLSTIGRKEQNDGKSYVKFRIYYVNELDKEKETIKWSSSDIATYTFPTE